MIRDVINEILRKKSANILLPFFDILDSANAISPKVLVLESRNLYQLIEYNEKIIW